MITVMDFFCHFSSLDDAVVRDASQKAFAALPDVSKAVLELTVLKGVGPATSSAVLAAYAPDVAPFMSDDAMVAVLGDSKDYSLKRYVTFVEKMQAKAKICDFGLAKWLPERWTHLTISKCEGTFGYLAPEFLMHGIVDEKTDVFAFGVLLLELIRGAVLSIIRSKALLCGLNLC